MATKVTLLAVLVVVGYKMFSPPPVQPPLPHERRKYGKEDNVDWIAGKQWLLVSSQIIVAFPAACEAVVLILRDHRGPVSGFVLSHLVYCDREYAYRLKMSSIFLAGWSAAVAGGLFRMHCYRVLGPQYTFQRAIIDGHQLITTGPYAIVRHPAYAGFNVYMLGTLIALLAGPGSWVTECGVLGSSTLGRFVVGAWVLCAFHFMVMAFCRCAGEDEVLRKEFGDKWVRWSQRTPARLLPGIY